MLVVCCCLLCAVCCVLLVRGCCVWLLFRVDVPVVSCR